MADRYVRSTDGSDADNGTTWALAKATLAGVSAIDAAGDRLFVSQAHAETTASTLTFAGAGAVANPVQLLCGNDGAEPPTALATTATVTTTSNASMNLNGSLYAYGISFICDGVLTLNNDGATKEQLYESCSFQSTNSGSGGQIWLNGSGNAMLRQQLLNCTFKLANASNRVYLYGDVHIDGGSFISGTTSPGSLFATSSDRTASNTLITGFDFSNLGSTFNIFQGAGVSIGRHVLRDCKLPASWSGSLVASGLTGRGEHFEMHNCDTASGTNYRLWVEDYAGSIKSESTIVRTGGASDGTTPISWKMVTSANTKYRSVFLESPEIMIWNDTTGGSKTVTVEIVHDVNVAGGQGAGTANAFQDDEVWLEVYGLATSGVPLATFFSDAKADVLAAAADQSSSSETWTTTGLTTPQKQALSKAFTPAVKGYIICKVVMAKASKTIYVCPKATVT